MKALILEGEFLERFGECEIAVSVEEVLKAFRLASDTDTPYDLICLDSMMLEPDGRKVLENIRRIEKEKGVSGDARVKIIIMTEADYGNDLKAYSGYYDVQMAKPIDSDKFLQEVKSVKSQINKANPGTEVTISLRCPCNYSCYYCVASHQIDPVVNHSLERIREIYESIGSFTLTTLECGAGEPIIHPQIRDILEICTESGVVTIPTNNSLAPKKWLPKNHPERLLVRTALHPQGEKILDTFLDRMLYLKELVADVTVIYVAHPKRLDKINEYTKYFAKHQITFDVTAFSGKYLDKNYPESYTPEELKILGVEESSYWYHRLVPEMSIRDFSGIPCLAGYRTMFIGPQTDLQRCLYDNAKLKNPYHKALPCRVKNCGCGLVLEELNTYQIEFWNNLRKIAGSDLLPQDSDRSNDELFDQNKAKYWELMKRYGKLEDKSEKSADQQKVVVETTESPESQPAEAGQEPESEEQLSHTKESFLAKAYWKHRERLNTSIVWIKQILQKTGSGHLISGYRWTQTCAFTLEFKPDLVIEIGRWHSIFTISLCNHVNMLRPLLSKVISVGPTADWKKDFRKIKSLVTDEWFEPVSIFQHDIYTFPFEEHIKEAQRILVFWSANGYDSAEFVLGKFLPLIADRQHAVITSLISDNRYLATQQRRYGKHKLWRKQTWDGSFCIIGNVASPTEEAINLVDFATRNGLTLFSADHSLHTEFDGDSERLQQMRSLLGRDFFDIRANWRWFSLNEVPFEPTFPKYEKRRGRLLPFRNSRRAVVI